MPRLFNALRNHPYFKEEKNGKFSFALEKEMTREKGYISISKKKSVNAQWGFIFEGEEAPLPYQIKDTPPWFIELFKEAQSDCKKINELKNIFNT